MPVCPQCDNRPFNNKEALLQHMKSSSAWHPFCSICDRRFVSSTAYDAHMAAKHPPTYDCLTCNKSFHAPFALEDHYRGSTNHPNCIRCGRGFRDDVAREEHLRTGHPKSPCGPCGGKLIYDDVLDQHYTESQNHPSCSRCGNGFKDAEANSEHIYSSHPEVNCSTCKVIFESPEATQKHFWDSQQHPKCQQCGMGFQDDEARELHMDMVHAPTPTAVATVPATELSPVLSLAAEENRPASLPVARTIEREITDLSSTGFTPLSPKNQAQRLIVGTSRVDSPDLQLDTNFASPIKDVPYSPSSLPAPGGRFDELWSSRENVQIPAVRAQQKAPERSGLSSALIPGPSRSPLWSATSANSSHSPQQAVPTQRSLSPPVASTSRASLFGETASTYPIAQTFSPPRSYYKPSPPQAFHAHSYPSSGTSSSGTLDISLFNPRAREFSPPQVSPPRPREAHHQISFPPQDEFHPRLYPGSARVAARAANRTSPPTEISFGRGPGSGYFGGSNYSDRTSPRRLHQYQPQSQSVFGNGAAATSVGRASPPSLGRSRGSGSVTSEQRSWQELMNEVNPDNGMESGMRATLFSETLSTPRAELPRYAQLDSPRDGMSSHLAHSGSSQMHNRNVLASPSLATASSPASSPLGHSPGSMRQEPDTRPTTAASTHPHSIHELTYTITPSSDCGSPRSPEVTSPVGLSVLPTISPLVSTPIDVLSFDIPEAYRPLPESPPPEVASPVTVVMDLKPREQEEVGVLSAPPMSATSSQSYITSPQEPIEESVQLMLPVPQVHSKSIQTALEASPLLTPTVARSPSTNSNILHCRACLADSCDDITATMCGHIFCNRCIVDAVIKTNRCPLCMTPTLLYCLFRLDMAA